MLKAGETHSLALVKKTQIAVKSKGRISKRKLRPGNKWSICVITVPITNKYIGVSVRGKKHRKEEITSGKNRLTIQ